MICNEKFFSFPPHLSVSWEQVGALSLNKTGQLVFHITNGESVTLPVLPKEQIDLIFKSHAAFLEKQVLKEPPIKKERFPHIIPETPEFPVRFAFGSLDGLQSAMQHNPLQSNAPNLPEEMLAKIANVAKILAPEDTHQLPKAEPHCNCFHCQIARAIHGETLKTQEIEVIEEEVTDKDLTFSQWEITQMGDKLYSVVNKLDTQEKYSVYLGHPVGCTCGKEGCEHILVVLKS